MGFMWKFGIMLEAEHNSILISGVPAPTLSEKRRSVHVEEIEDEDAPRRSIPVLKTTNHSCLKSTKVEPPKST
jgi:hypothetical protein